MQVLLAIAAYILQHLRHMNLINGDKFGFIPYTPYPAETRRFISGFPIQKNGKSSSWW